jgi:hypothetical protein
VTWPATEFLLAVAANARGRQLRPLGEGASKRSRTRRYDPNYGSVWTWTAIDADTKLIASWLVGDGTSEDCTVSWERC